MATLIELHDTIELEDGAVKRTADGYLVASARVARTGVQLYTAKELGLKDRDPSAKVRVYRPPSEVFDTKAMASIAWRPMTNNHPTGKVTAKNWKKLSIGQVGDQVVRDGDFIRVPLTLMDSAAIEAYDAGKKELSVGYRCEIEMADGIVPDGEHDAGQTYDAVQHDIRANHIALCDRARGGDHLRIGDQKPEPEPRKMKTILVDGIPVAEVSDAAEAVINRLTGQLATSASALAVADAKVGDLTTTVATHVGEIAALNAKLKDAEITPARLSKLAAERATLIDSAKPLLGDSYKFDDKTDVEIRKAAVHAKIGDAALTMEDAAISGAFAVLAATKDAGGDQRRRDPIREVIGDQALRGEKDPRAMRDEAKAKRIATMQDAYLGKDAA